MPKGQTNQMRSLFATKSSLLSNSENRIKINVYCDETCHLEHDGHKAMALGAIWCPKDKIKEINYQIQEIKLKYNIPKKSEVKWTKISPCNLNLYLDLVDYFFDNDNLHFRTLIVPDKSKLDHEKYNQTHDQWYHKMYFDLLKIIFHKSSSYYVYIDIKDTHSGENIKKLQEVCSHNAYDINNQIIKHIQPIRSDEVQLMQIVDIFTGAMGYRYNNMDCNKSISSAKVEVVNRIIQRSGSNLLKNSLPSDQKFNIFIWLTDWNDNGF